MQPLGFIQNLWKRNKLRDAAESIRLPTFIVADAGRTQDICINICRFQRGQIPFLLLDQGVNQLWILLPGINGCFDIGSQL
ncbi:uncharacterized protein LOC142532603 isoform X4 [Primulina tabacum]|uniref:uncharacterized protein LOC142532603 isoform X4 n=1 Tax=Primulina tabacum TaxID=48773 RepID=UPI003F5AA631